MYNAFACSFMGSDYLDIAIELVFLYFLYSHVHGFCVCMKRSQNFLSRGKSYDFKRSLPLGDSQFDHSILWINSRGDSDSGFCRPKDGKPTKESGA